jgi:hypothetical protein
VSRRAEKFYGAGTAAGAGQIFCQAPAFVYGRPPAWNAGIKKDLTLAEQHIIRGMP